MGRTYTVRTGKVLKQGLTRAHFVFHPSHCPIFAEDVHSFCGEGPVLGGPCVHEQVIGLTSALIKLRARVAVQVSLHVSAGGRRAGPVSIRAAGAVWIQGVWRPLILEHLLEDATAVPWSHAEPDPLLWLLLAVRQHGLLHRRPAATLRGPRHGSRAPGGSFGVRLFVPVDYNHV